MKTVIKKFTFFILVSTLYFFWGQLAMPVYSETIKIGNVNILSGPGAIYGLPNSNGIKMAIEEINAKGGIEVGGKKYQLNLVQYDGRSVPGDAMAAMEKLINQDKVKIFIGLLGSSSALATRDLTKRYDIVALNDGAYISGLTVGYPNLFRIQQDFRRQTEAALHTHANLFKTKSISLVFDKTLPHMISQCEDMKNVLGKKGVKISSLDGIGRDETDFYPLVTKIKKLDPESIHMTAYVGQVANFVKSAKELNIKAKISQITSGTREQFKSVVDLKIMEGVYDVMEVSLDIKAKEEPRLKSWIERYEKKFPGSPASNWGALGYDAVHIYAVAIKNANTFTDVKRIVEALNKMKIFPELINPFVSVGEGNKLFDAEGQAAIEMEIRRWGKDGPEIVQKW